MTPDDARVQLHLWPEQDAADTAAGSPPHFEGSLNTTPHNAIA